MKNGKNGTTGTTPKMFSKRIYSINIGTDTEPDVIWSNDPKDILDSYGVETNGTETPFKTVGVYELTGTKEMRLTTAVETK